MISGYWYYFKLKYMYFIYIISFLTSYINSLFEIFNTHAYINIIKKCSFPQVHFFSLYASCNPYKANLEGSVKILLISET